ncbi:CD300E [Ovibos moschatus]
MWLPSALLLLCLPGCLSLTGPGSVAGTTGSSLRVRCQYEKAYKGHNKYWCRGKYGRGCRKIVETEGEEKEKRNGRVSIRDHVDNLTFTVTMENLNMNDTGSYWCRIQTIWILDVLSWDPSVQVEVSVFPAPSTTPGSTACLAVPDTLQTVNDGQNLSTEEMLTHCPGSRLSNIHFLLLVFLKLPLFLGMVGAVLWVNRPQRHPEGRERQLDPGSPPCSVPFPGMPCPGIQLFRLDKRDLQILGSRAGGQQLLDSGRTQVFWGHWSREGPGS